MCAWPIVLPFPALAAHEPAHFEGLALMDFLSHRLKAAGYKSPRCQAMPSFIRAGCRYPEDLNSSFS